ncbi:ribosome small subunit-dependent GTPase A [Halonatronum saccharophilum]|uniref:ribosome small subunit-dependent GTPase A n=1 Tax=Halonatronum saccharophilum TaxID=150060 RepID=UPI00048794D5|nr:ribosome small subunit-dependent GTPase A [Halonatronum saccharophilum]
MNLIKLGWNDDYLKDIDREGYKIARVAIKYRDIYKVYSEEGEILAETTGKMRYNEAFPAVGDWVLVSINEGDERAIIHSILPRKSKVSRKVAGNTTYEQVVASNLDTIFIVSSLNQDFNLRRIERYLTIVWESGANPVIVLSKADLCPDVDSKIMEVEGVAFGVPVHPISSLTDEGIGDLSQYLQEGETVALIGSSGVGKSTLVNKLIGEERLKVQDIREDDDKGKHTTTHRELIPLKEGGVIIDTPGMREIQLWDGGEGLKDTFGDIEELASRCHFNDCNHDSEPKCAVKRAIEEGELPQERLKSYRKLQRELEYIELKKKYGSEGASRIKLKRMGL